MYFSAQSLDDLLRLVFQRLLKKRTRINPTRGRASEETGVLLTLRNIRTRLSRTENRGHPFSCLGEFLWYMSGSNSLTFIKHYLKRYAEESEDAKTIYGAYGPRFLAMCVRSAGPINQLRNIQCLLQHQPDSRRAVIQIFDASDMERYHKEVPCTLSLQFMIRRDLLDLHAVMRSNDAFLGLPHDVFSFTMLQELMARALHVDVGAYNHYVGSLHLYDRDRDEAQAFLDEAWQDTVEMPQMPIGDPWPQLAMLLKAERTIRGGRKVDPRELVDEPYWQDLMRLLLAHKQIKVGDRKGLARTRKSMHSKIYNTYIDRRARKLERRQTPHPIQGQLL